MTLLFIPLSSKLIILPLKSQDCSFPVSFFFQWVVTNLRRFGSPDSSSFSWVFDLEGIADMYKSYEETNLWYFHLALFISHYVSKFQPRI